MRSRKSILFLVSLGFILLTVGCYSFHPIPPPGPGVFRTLKVVTRNGEEYELNQVQVDSMTVSGNVARDGRMEFPLEEVGVFEERRFNGLKTAGLVVVSVPAAFGVFVIIALANWAGS